MIVIAPVTWLVVRHFACNTEMDQETAEVDNSDWEYPSKEYYNDLAEAGVIGCENGEGCVSHSNSRVEMHTVPECIESNHCPHQAFRFMECRDGRCYYTGTVTPLIEDQCGLRVWTGGNQSDDGGYTFVWDGHHCDDYDPCTEKDRCVNGGICRGVPISCDDGNSCSTDMPLMYREAYERNGGVTEYHFCICQHQTDNTRLLDFCTDTVVGVRGRCNSEGICIGVPLTQPLLAEDPEWTQ